MNKCLIIGAVVEAGSLAPVGDVSVTLGHAVFSEEARGIQVHNEAGGNQVRATTEASGYFQLPFSFDPVNLGHAIGSLRYTVQAQALVLVTGGGHAARQLATRDGRMVLVISLREVADGAIPRPTNPDALAMSILQIARRVRETQRRPRTGPVHPQGTRPTPGRPRGYGMLTTPSAEMVQFFGAIQIEVRRPAGMTTWS